LREGYNFNIVGDYIIEFYYPALCSQTFQIFFDSIESIEKLNTELFKSVFHMRVPCTLRLRYDPEHCKQTKKIMEELQNDYKIAASQSTELLQS
jgi:hypothetical protein